MNHRMPRRIVAFLLIAGVIALVLGVWLNSAGSGTKPRLLSGVGEPTEKTRMLGSASCGIERWSVKTLADSPTLKPPIQVTIASLNALAVPAGFNSHSPRLPGESQEYRLVGARLVSVKLEADSDYHLVLQSPTSGKTMIAEIPNPACARGSSQLAAITATRAYFDQTFGPGTGSFRQIGRLVTITGVAFFDVLHGQTGVASNGIELHPVLALRALS